MEKAVECAPLRHLVMFGFKEGVSEVEIDEVVSRFSSLRESCPGVTDFEWGVDVSSEGLANGHTHCFTLTFKSETDRDAYLPHSAHMAFADWVGQYLEKVTVIDYWVNHVAGGEA